LGLIRGRLDAAENAQGYLGCSVMGSVYAERGKAAIRWCFCATGFKSKSPGILEKSSFRLAGGLLAGLCGEADAALLRLRRRHHELADRLEHGAELGVVLLLQRLQFAGQLGVCRQQPPQADEGATISMFTRTARRLRSTADSMATPCSVKA
jgi:hypothetical protein